MAGFTQVLIYLLVRWVDLQPGPQLTFAQGIVSWPIAKLLEIILGPHHGIIYRRAGLLYYPSCTPRVHVTNTELKELIAMHSSMSPLGGDLKTDTVTIIGATLDLQEKVVKQVKKIYSKAGHMMNSFRLGDDTYRRRLYAFH